MCKSTTSIICNVSHNALHYKYWLLFRWELNICLEISWELLTLGKWGSVGISTSTLEHTEYQTLYLKQKFWCKLRIGKSKLIVIFSGYCCHVHNCLLNKISKSIITIFQYAIPISHCLECLSSSNIAFLKEINTVLEVDYCCYFIWFYGSTSVADFKYHQGVV